MSLEKKRAKLSMIKGVSITSRRGGWRVYLSKAITKGVVFEKQCKELRDAINLVEDWVEVKNTATSAARLLSDRQMEDSLEAYRILADSSVKLSLVEVIRDYTSKLPKSSTRTVSDAVKAYLDNAERENRSDGYIRNLNTYFNSFAKLYADRYLHEVDRDDIEEWLAVSCYGKSSKTYNNYLVSIKALYEFACDKDWLTANPSSKLRKLKIVPSEPCIFSIKDLTSVLMYCKKNSWMNELLAFSLQAFAGIRRSEVLALTWGAISDSIRVTSSSSKINKGRGVPILPSLKKVLGFYDQWCDPTYRDDLVINISPDVWDARKSFIREQLGIAWGHNQLRHSFVSYRLALEKDIAKTAYESGHSPAVMQAHYDAICNTKDAILYFAIVIK